MKNRATLNLRDLIKRDGVVACSSTPAFPGARVHNETSFGRVVLSCRFVDTGHDLAITMVSHGFAVDWKCFSGGKFADAMNSARDAEKGLWAVNFAEMSRFSADRSSLESCDSPARHHRSS